ncbi:hypothetical protein [Jiangella anatolica]|uniref:Uncharacterized protein n=1 Tax=Jiangella anatolica TaxID=2670374 RepID=A0A2W2BGC1_9ACTN|nr:hypothetical protein [Jiangella anatolica]PZF79318.1 hypothetical protein C1I92_31790 [Jiangella anatolica]
MLDGWKVARMMRLIVQGGDYLDLDADVMTFDDGALVLWRRGAEVGRQQIGRVSAVELGHSVQKSEEAPAAPSYKLTKIRRDHPKAYARWTAEEEEVLARLHGEGRSISDIARTMQRQPGGIRSRLERLGLQTPEVERESIG